MAETDDDPVDIIKLQQEFYEMFGHQTSVIYDCYKTKESLEVKISLIHPDLRPEQQTNLTQIIWDQKKFSDEKYLLMSPIFICCIYDNASIKERLTYPLNIKSKRFSMHPVFRIRKCLKPYGDNTRCCAIFVDEFARVYTNWKDFVEKNKYEDSLVVTPNYGTYNGSIDDKVLLDIFIRKSGFTKNLDTGATVVGLGSAGIAAAAFIPTLVVAPAVIAGAAVAGISCAVYTGLRSVYDLYDRRNHKQSIAIRNKEARSSWINIAAGTFTASAAGATQMITKAAQNGQNISHITRTTIRLMNVGALSLHTTGCLDGFHTMLYNFYNGEKISKVQLTQLSASLFLLTHSIKNFRTAENLLKVIDKTNPESMKQILCEKQKFDFRHLVNETVLVRGLRSDTGQTIVRSIKNLLNSKELLKLIEEHKAQMELEMIEVGDEMNALAENKDITINARVEEDISESMSEAIRTEYCELFDTRVASIVNGLSNQVKHRGNDSLRLIVIHLLEKLHMKAFDVFITFAQELLVRTGSALETKIQRILHFECFLKMIFVQIEEFANRKNQMDAKEFLLSLTADTKAQIDYDIRQYLNEQNAKTIEIFENSYDNDNCFETDLNENPKVLIMITERTDQILNRFSVCCSAVSSNELRETIEDISKKLSCTSADNFFSIAKKLIDKYAANVQFALGQFIPNDIFLTDIYCLLSKISSDNFDSVNEYLFQYTDDLHESIVNEFKNWYKRPTNNGKAVRCTVCSGEFYI